MTVKSITEITDHADVAVSRLPQQYKDATKKYPAFWQPELASGWEGLIQSFVSPAQEFETIANKMLNERGLLSGEGINLDRIGQIVGQSRDSLTDIPYRGKITAKIAENNSDGTAANLLAIADLLLGPELRDLSIREFYPAKVQIEYFVEDKYTVDETNDFAQAEADFGVSGEIDITLTHGDFFPTELVTLFEDAFLVALGTPLVVSWDAGARTFTFHLDDVATPNPAVIWGSAGDLYGFPPPQVVDVTKPGEPIPGPSYNSEAIIDALKSAKLAGVDIAIELIVLGNYFGFSNDGESIGFGALLPQLLNVSYYSTYNFPTNIDDIGFNRYIDPSSSGLNRELGFVIRVADFANFTNELDTLSKGFDIIDKNGDRFTFINYAGTPVQYNTEDQTPDQYRLWIEMSTNVASSEPLGDLYKNGSLLNFADWDAEFAFSFGTYFRGDGVLFNAANPFGLGNESDPTPILLGGGNYSTLID